MFKSTPPPLVDADGTMLKLAKRQGYVPAGCTMDGFMVMALVNGGDDPCRDCDGDRTECGGRSFG